MKFPIQRQAVLLVHGIGNQIVEETLSDFVLNLYNASENSSQDSQDPKKKREHFDTIRNGGLEYNSVFQVFDKDINVRFYTWFEDDIRITDFYEFYWAHLVPTDESPSKATISWLWGKLMKRGSPTLPANLSAALFGRFYYKLIGVLALLVVFFTVLYLGYKFAPAGTMHLFGFDLKSLLGWLWGVCGVSLISHFWSSMVAVVGDAAMYLYSSPATFQARENIRKAGASLIDQLHDAKEPDGTRRYDRIIVAGHSLGTLIAYDALQYCFAKRNANSWANDAAHLLDEKDKIENEKNGYQVNLREKKFPILEITENFNELVKAAKELSEYRDQLKYEAVKKAFRSDKFYHCDSRGFGATYNVEKIISHAQKRYRLLQRKVFDDTTAKLRINSGDKTNSEPRLDWRVSDFITMGSPLTYAAFLLMDKDPSGQQNLKEFDDYLGSKGLNIPDDAQASKGLNIAQANWPTNGWFETKMGLDIFPTCPPRSNYREFYMHYKHEDACLSPIGLFALTRWTNLYVPHDHKLLSGDIISGPLGPVFGLGIKDIALDPKEVKRSGFAHTLYWSSQETDWDAVKKNRSRSQQTGDKTKEKSIPPSRIQALLDALDLEYKAEKD